MFACVEYVKRCVITLNALCVITPEPPRFLYTLRFYKFLYICLSFVTFFVFLFVSRFFTLSRKPGRVFKSFLGAVARYTQILGPWRAMMSHGDPVCIESYSNKYPSLLLFVWSNHVLGVDFVIYGPRKGRDPARVVDGIEVCRQNHKSSENDLRKVPIVK